jgi:hypothetical protein
MEWTARIRFTAPHFCRCRIYGDCSQPFANAAAF